MSKVSFAKLASVLLIAAAALLCQVQGKSLCGIGTRIHGDQLLVKDVLASRSPGVGRSQEIIFNYDIPEPITYIEILSEESVQAEVNFSYQNDLVEGTVTAINASAPGRAKAEPFEVLVMIYGFNDTMLNVNPAYIINKDQHFRRRLEPELNDAPVVAAADDDDQVYVDQYPEFDDVSPTEHGPHPDDEEYDFDAEFEMNDEIIELGRRQTGDYLLYETDASSTAKSLEVPDNHSVTFYYIDSNFLTWVRFVVFDHFVGQASGSRQKPLLEYSHISSSTMKAIIADNHATSLFVKMSVYGYKPADLPVGYVPFLANIGVNSPAAGIGTGVYSTTFTEAPMSSLQRLKWLMNQGGQPTDAADSVSATLKTIANDGDADAEADDNSTNNDNEGNANRCRNSASGRVATTMSVLLSILAPLSGLLALAHTIC